MPDRAMPQANQPAPPHNEMPGHNDMPGNDTRPAEKSSQEMSHDMPGMDMSDTGHGMPMHGQLGRYGMSREASGTSWQPQAAPHSAIHVMADDWMVMLHGRVSGIADWQSGPRGDDQFFSTYAPSASEAMPAAMPRSAIGNRAIFSRTMPATHCWLPRRVCARWGPARLTSSRATTTFAPRSTAKWTGSGTIDDSARRRR